MMSALASGVLLGLSAGLAPGPLLALVVAQSLRHGAREGCKIALSPLVTDAPIILVALLVATRLTAMRPMLGLLSLAGGAFVLYLAWEGLGAVEMNTGLPAERPRSWVKGIATNLLSPHPWLFWLTVGAATLAQAKAHSGLAAMSFLFGFYLLLVGCKVGIALGVARSRDLLTGTPYRVAMRVLSALLAVFALRLGQQGWRDLTGA